MLVQHLVDVRQARAGADHRAAVGQHGDVGESADIKHQAVGRRASDEAMPTAARHEVRTRCAGERDCTYDVRGRRAAHDRTWPDVTELRQRGLPSGVVGRRARFDHLAFDDFEQRFEINVGLRHPSMLHASRER
ncbi:MAG TPA: hypothetical protein VE442_25570 [Jatrophihabitans sp.]|nr:hypothetical protein [Jatrophihabitans sp.]